VKRVVSLVPSVTETLLAWGVEPVAVTRFCEQPSLHQVGGTKNPSIDEIVALRPDLVVMDEEENRREDAEALAAAGLSVHATAVRSVADVAPALSALAGALDGRPVSIPADLSFPPLRRRAFVPIWRRPYMTINADTYGSSVLAAIGIENVFASADERYPTVTLEDALASSPDVVLAPSEPYAFDERHRDELEAVAPVVFVDGRDLFWWGVRTEVAVGRLWRAIG
jgi:ABC-type Fe3+-hydroxamate transport system substrate-binding protein